MLSDLVLFSAAEKAKTLVGKEKREKRKQQALAKAERVQKVTLACEGQTCKAHKMVLSACSPYFKALLEENPSKHPIIILKDVSYIHLQAILEFMYAGEVNVSQEQLPAFLKTADRLKVKGLAETPSSIKREG
ncbi:lolal [Drosophila busckii]|uniref:Lolal n=1 Tax=Drosophila busckii TaxID=30019 RepID=A0A0M4E6Q5_DROBS|nr:lolal [Drosophila busckii]